MALREAAQPAFKDYAQNIVHNARALAEALVARGYDVVSGGTDNHLILVDLTRKNVPGKLAAKALDRAGIELNYNSVPFDTRKPFDPSGIRLGTPAVTSRGMGLPEMKQIADWMDRVIREPTEDGLREGVRRGARGDRSFSRTRVGKLLECTASDRQTETGADEPSNPPLWPAPSRRVLADPAPGGRTARAEVIELVDKTKMNAKIVHYYDGVYTVEAGGNTVKLPKDKMKSISFQLPAARAEFSTAEKTFDRWRKALNDG